MKDDLDKYIAEREKRSPGFKKLVERHRRMKDAYDNAPPFMQWLVKGWDKPLPMLFDWEKNESYASYWTKPDGTARKMPRIICRHEWVAPMGYGFYRFSDVCKHCGKVRP